MSGYWYSQQTTPSEEDDFEFDQPVQTRPQSNVQSRSPYQQFTAQSVSPPIPQVQTFNNPQQLYQYPQQFLPQQQYQQQPQQQHYSGLQPATQYQSQYTYQTTPVSTFVTPTVPSNYPYQTQTVTPFPPYSEPVTRTPRMASAGPSATSAGHLSPDEAGRTRPSRATSYASSRGSGGRSYSHSDVSTRSTSPSIGEMQRWGHQNNDGTWSCRVPGCSSKSTFSRGCDLRKHYKRHTKSLFCRIAGCPQATEGGFSSKKDRARHEAKHNPNVVCEWEGCDRLFSRMDNMVCLCPPSLSSRPQHPADIPLQKDHVRRVHRRHSQR